MEKLSTYIMTSIWVEDPDRLFQTTAMETGNVDLILYGDGCSGNVRLTVPVALARSIATSLLRAAAEVEATQGAEVPT